MRVPDLVVVDSAAGVDRARCAAADVRLACEIVSRGSVRTDRITKLAEYSDAGIEHYWLVDLTTAPPSVETYRRRLKGYDRIDTTRGSTVSVTSPASLTVNLETLAS